MAISIPPTCSAVVQADYDENHNKRTGVMERVVMLRYTRLQVCGGSGVLVGSRHVLTAAHGVEGWSAGSLTIDLDDKKNTRVKVDQIFRHPDKKIDLALLRLVDRVDVEPIPPLDREPRRGERVWLGGFGIYGSPGKPRGYGRFHAGFNLVTEVRNGRAKIRFDRDGEPGESLPAAFDSGSPVWVETPDGWRLSGITVTASGRTGPKFGDISWHQTLAPVREWLTGLLQADPLAEPREHEKRARPQ